MSQKEIPGRRKRSISLSVRVSGLLMLAAILPLLTTVITIEMLSRPTLIAQTSQEMLTDAQTHTQLINDYFAQQLLETDALSRLQPIQRFLTGDTTDVAQAQAQQSLASGRSRGSYYEDWSLLDLQGNPQLYYPTAPERHGLYYISPTNLQQFRPNNIQQIQARSSLISDVFYNQVTNEAYMDIYAPVFSTDYNLVGILRASFDLHYIWDILNKETGANGDGSYAMVFDANGVCVAHSSPNPDQFAYQVAPDLFKSIAPLSTATQQTINQNGLYGSDGNMDIAVLDHGDQLMEVMQANDAPSTFELVPPSQQSTFQGAKSTVPSLHWTYMVLSPLSNVTAIADDQLRLTGIITLAIAILAALIGLGIGQRITRPILSAVEYLHSSSTALKSLADKEQSAATQQIWVVDSSQVGLRTVQYYTRAAGMALRRVNHVSSNLVQYWHQVDTDAAKQAVEQMVGDVQYIERAIDYQDASNKKLASTIKVTIQVAEQLATAATSATEAAEQLEQVVDQLQHVIGQ